MEKSIIYFEKPGKVNTVKTLNLALKRAKECGIKTIIVASTYGYTAQKALEILEDTDQKYIIVGTDRNFFNKELLQILENKKIPIFFAREVEYPYQESMKNAFRKFSEGVKVCMDISMVASEMGTVSEEKEIITVAGTGASGFDDGGGADTALIMIPRKSDQFNILPEKSKRREIKEIICKPR